MSVDFISETQLQSEFKKSCSESAWIWFSLQLNTARNHSDDLAALDIALAMARRKLGDDVLDVTHSIWSNWRLCDAGRVLLVAELCRQQQNLIENPVQRAYRLGDEYEKEAILKGLCLLDPDGALCPLAVDACRTNIVPMLAAIAMSNPYPATFFPEHEFNQMVLKSLFLGLDISRIFNLSGRINPSLSRMCFDYLRERLAASRDLPPSIWLAIRASDVDNSLVYVERCLAMGDPLLRAHTLASLRCYCEDMEGVAALVQHSTD